MKWKDCFFLIRGNNYLNGKYNSKLGDKHVEIKFKLSLEIIINNTHNGFKQLY